VRKNVVSEQHQYKLAGSDHKYSYSFLLFLFRKVAYTNTTNGENDFYISISKFFTDHCIYKNKSNMKRTEVTPKNYHIFSGSKKKRKRKKNICCSNITVCNCKLCLSKSGSYYWGTVVWNTEGFLGISNTA